MTPIPRGCKEYYFGETGIIEAPSYMEGDIRYNDWKRSRPNIIFTCIASNDKNALRKFSKWKATSQETGALAD